MTPVVVPMPHAGRVIVVRPGDMALLERLRARFATDAGTVVIYDRRSAPWSSGPRSHAAGNGERPGERRRPQDGHILSDRGFYVMRQRPRGRRTPEGVMSQSDGAQGVPSLDGVRVLVVDDHPGVRDVVTAVLKGLGALVTAVSGAREALEVLGRERPRVLISDVEMPGEDGYALIRKVRGLGPERGGEIPAVALTGLHGAEDRARLLRAGFQDHVPKPVDVRRLTTVVSILATRD